MTKTIKTLKAMKVKSSSLQIRSYVVVRLNKKTWRLGELMGDWIMTGSVEEVANRLS